MKQQFSIYDAVKMVALFNKVKEKLFFDVYNISQARKVANGLLLQFDNRRVWWEFV